MLDRDRIVAAYRALVEKMPSAPLPCFRVVFPDGGSAAIGHGAPTFSLVVRDQDGASALGSMDGLAMAEAFMDEHLDIEGNLLAATRYAEVLNDVHPMIFLWRRLQPILLGRERVNPSWIAQHYDSGNVQLHAIDRDYDTYTPGHYAGDDDTLEAGAERKLAMAFEQLGLRPGDHLLDVGCGWGGMIRYAARRGVRVTGITLSTDQLTYVAALIAREKLEADVRHQDFFTFEPGKRFDGVTMMGVIEDLSDYRRTLHSLGRMIARGRRVYLDFAASRTRFGTHSFVTRYIWPGTFRMVFMPELMEAIRESPFELVHLTNDRRNYYLWCKGMHERWAHNRMRVEAEYGKRTWRMLALLFAGCAAMMDYPSHTVTAFRMLLELPPDGNGIFSTSRARRAADRFSSAAAVMRSTAVHVGERLAGALQTRVSPNSR
ncbi:MAG TPA: class I SAM-dependent methyltransferase [Polyangiaceae bacterium]|nr:class I SAM-dependent methyltransferase [Polyangiaceae bacterium]